ncbi:MAG: hypothetical protein LBJ00_14670 [Planctomycetaceae bacterium]|jgi:Tfp pilus assembly protein PilF|nr:hypothetical protein [Planctomycetaceae bacterium]
MHNTISFILIILVVSGCVTGSNVVPKYETVTSNPRRDVEAATKQNKLGLEALSKGKVEKAEGYFKEALVKDVDFGPAHNNLGRLYFDQGKNYLAAWEFEYAIKVMPRRFEPYNNLGLVMERVGKLEQAIDAYENANILHPNRPEVVGNLLRAHWCFDKSSMRTRELLEQLVFIDSRPDWVSWSKEQIAIGKISNETTTIPYNSPPNTTINPTSNKIPLPIPILPPHIPSSPQ